MGCALFRTYCSHKVKKRFARPSAGSVTLVCFLFTGQGVCHVAGDPHYYTFDGVMHTFMGTCTYTLVEVCNSSQVTPFTIVAKNEERGQPEASYVNSVTIRLPTVSITLSKASRVLVRARVGQ